MEVIRPATAKVSGLNLSAEGWQLFNQTGAEAVAETLNTSFMDYVNRGFFRNEVRDSMCSIMKFYSNYGAIDTEPTAVLNDLLDQAFGAESA